MNAALNMNVKSVLETINAASMAKKLDIIMDWLVHIKNANDAAIVATIGRIVRERSHDRYLPGVAKAIMKDELLHEIYLSRFNVVDPAHVEMVIPVTFETLIGNAASIEFEPTPSNQRDAKLAVDAAALDGWDAA